MSGKLKHGSPVNFESATFGFQHENCIKIYTNKPTIALVVLEKALGLVPNSRRGQLDTTGMIDVMGMTGFYFDHDTISSKLTLLTSK